MSEHKYWLDGLAVVSSTAANGEVKYWKDGLPLENIEATTVAPPATAFAVFNNPLVFSC